MYRLSILAASLSLLVAACGSSDPGYRPSNAPFFGVWKATSSPAVLGAAFSTESSPFNASASADSIIPCDGSLGNSGSVNGVGEGMVRVTGTLSKGTIQFGHTKYVGASDSRCRDVSKEGYSYEINDLEMTVCLVNPSYPYCTTYSWSISPIGI